jgi:Flp pilus assembly protein TadG
MFGRTLRHMFHKWSGNMFGFGRYLLKRATTRRFRHDTSGATAVEFAMVIPLFLLVLGVIVETGIMMFTEYVLQTSVQEAARLVRTGQAQEKQLTAAQFKTEICRIAKIIMACESKVTVYMKAATSFSDLASDPSASYMNVGVNADGTTAAPTYQCGKRDEMVALIASYDYNFKIPYFMEYFGNFNSKKTRRMAGFAMFKNEPFPVTTKACG